MTRGESKQVMLRKPGAMPMVADALEEFKLVRGCDLPRTGDGGGVWSFIHTGDTAEATSAAPEHGRRCVCNIVDNEAAPIVEAAALSRTLGAQQPMQMPQPTAGEAGAC
jgi:nucleoside-diphosphate-sugar epimerase